MLFLWVLSILQEVQGRVLQSSHDLAKRSNFYDNDSKQKFPFYWMANPRRYKDISKSLLSVESRRIVEVLE